MEVDQSCTNTQELILASSSFQAVDEVFVQVTGSGNDRIIKSGSSKHLVCFLGKISKVTTVDTDAVLCKRDTFFAHFFEYADGIRNTGFQNIVGINQ
mgnify:CR=1 FL=1